MNIAKWVITGISITMILGWSAYGIYLFNSPEFITNWAVGELGDFFGGGIGAIAVGLLVFTAWVQQDQFKHYKSESFEAGVFRVFEGLKPEAEGISARIVSKLVATGKIELEDDFDSLIKKFKESDRTVFLRTMQKEPAKSIISKRKFGADDDLIEACERFYKILTLIDNSIDNTRRSEPNNQDFAEALEATEIFRTYKLCFMSGKAWKK